MKQERLLFQEVVKMQLLYNVIKNTSIKSAGAKEIITNEELPNVSLKNEKDAESHIVSYENLARAMLENARRQNEAIIARAYEEARNIEEEAQIKAEEIFKNAFTKGQSEGYSMALEKAKEESEAIIASAEEMLKNAKLEYENYLESKKQEINELILTIAKSTLKKEVLNKDAINDMIYDALESSKNSKNFIIRCNKIYVEEIKLQLKDWKERLGYFGDIFVIGDNSIEPGNALIDKGNGKILVGIDTSLLKIKAILEEKE